MKKKQIALLLASAMAVSSLTGCGQGQEATTYLLLLSIPSG